MENIYDELDNFTQVAEYDKLKEENIRLRQCVQEMEQKISTLTQDNELLLDKFSKLEVSFASLLKTARAEIHRKSEMIKSLNDEKNQLIFRQIGNRNNPNKYSRSDLANSQESSRPPAKRKPGNTLSFENKIPRLEKQHPVNEGNDNLLPAATKEDKKKKPNPRSISPIYSSGDELNVISEKNVLEKDCGLEKEKFETNQDNRSYPAQEKEPHMDKRQMSKESSHHSRNESTNKRKNRWNDDLWEENSETSDRLVKQTSRQQQQYDEGYNYRKTSPKEFENTRFRRGQTSRFSRSEFREKAYPRYSKSNGRSDSGRYGSDRYQHSPSSDPNIVSRESQSRFSSRNTYKSLRRRSNTREDRQTSPYRWNQERKYGDNARKRFYEQPPSKNKDWHDSKDKDSHEKNLNLQEDKNNKDDISNFLNRMEEEYKMHPDNINELQLDEETKDYYHNDNLILLRSHENEKLQEDTFTQEVTKDNNVKNIRVCQSPDLHDPGCSDVPTACRNIQGNGLLTPMDDPRLYHKEYFDEEYVSLNKLSKLSNDKELHKSITISIKNRFEDIDLKVPNYQNKIPKDQKLCNEQITQIYANIDDDICDASLESGELNNTFYCNEMNELDNVKAENKNEDLKLLLKTKSDTKNNDVTNKLHCDSNVYSANNGIDQNKAEKKEALNEKSKLKYVIKNKDSKNELCNNDKNENHNHEKDKKNKNSDDSTGKLENMSDKKNQEVTNKLCNNKKSGHHSDKTDRKKKIEHNNSKEKSKTKSDIQNKEIMKTLGNNEKTENNHNIEERKQNKRDKESKEKSQSKSKINTHKEVTKTLHHNENNASDRLQKREKYENSKEKTKAKTVFKNIEVKMKRQDNELFGDDSLITPEDLLIADAAVNDLNKVPQRDLNYFEKLIEMEVSEKKPNEVIPQKVKINLLSANQDVCKEPIPTNKAQEARNENELKNANSVSMQHSSDKTEQKEIDKTTVALDTIDNTLVPVVPTFEAQNSGIDATVVPASKVEEKTNLNKVTVKNSESKPVSHFLERLHRNNDSEVQTDSDCERPLFSTSTPNPKLYPEQKKSPKQEEAVSKQTSVNLYCNEDSLQSNSEQFQSLPQTNSVNKRLIIVRRRRVIVTKE